MILIRHGQSEFNVRFAVDRVDPGIEDPGLTDLGKRQIAEAARLLSEQGHHERLTRIHASPYTRTLESAEILAERLGLPIVINSLVREHAHFACDIGSPRPVLAARWPGIDFDPLPEVWWPDREDEQTVDRRAMDFRAQAAEEPDWEEWLVVTHWGFIRSLTGHRVANAAILAFDPTHPHPDGAALVSVPDVC